VTVELHQKMRAERFLIDIVKSPRAALHHPHHTLDHIENVLVFGLFEDRLGLERSVVAGGILGAIFRLTSGAV
jgi:hypothetical protein